MKIMLLLIKTQLWEEGNPPDILTTRGWNEGKGVTEAQRTKEEASEILKV